MTKILEEIGAESGAGRERRRKSFPHSYKASIALDAYDIRVYDRLRDPPFGILREYWGDETRVIQDLFARCGRINRH